MIEKTTRQLAFELGYENKYNSFRAASAKIARSFGLKLRIVNGVPCRVWDEKQAAKLKAYFATHPIRDKAGRPRKVPNE